MPIEKVLPFAIASQLNKPFTMIEIARVDDFSARLFICQGAVPWHRHTDQDELFFVLEGEISLDSEWNNIILRPGEMATVPKGIAHRSHSTLWSVVMLLEGIFPFTRRDGDRRMPVASGDEAHLEQVNLAEESRKLYQPFTPVNLIAVDDFMMRMILVQGEGRPHRHQKRSELFFVHEGVVQLQTEEGDVTLEEGEITVVPREVEHRLVAGDRAILLLFARS